MKKGLSALLLLLSVASLAQTKVELNVEKAGDSEQFKLKLEQTINGEKVVTEKSYTSMEEMKNDPDLKDLDLHFMEENGHSFTSKEGNVLIDIDEEVEGDHKMIFISDGEKKETKLEITMDEDDTKHILKNGKEVNMDEIHKDGEKVFIIKTDGKGKKKVKKKREVEVTVEDDGTYHVKVDGKEVDYEEWQKENKMQTGSKSTMIIEEDENGEHVKKKIIIIKEE